MTECSHSSAHHTYHIQRHLMRNVLFCLVCISHKSHVLSLSLIPPSSLVFLPPSLFLIFTSSPPTSLLPPYLSAFLSLSYSSSFFLSPFFLYLLPLSTLHISIIPFPFPFLSLTLTLSLTLFLSRTYILLPPSPGEALSQ